MSIIITDLGMQYGDVEEKKLSKLPDGFTYIIKSDDWVLATDGTKVYYAGKTKLYPKCIATEADVIRTKDNERPFKIGDEFMNNEEGVIEL